MDVDQIEGRVLDDDPSDQGKDGLAEMERSGHRRTIRTARELPDVVPPRRQRRPGQDGHAFLEIHREAEGPELDAAVHDLVDFGEAEGLRQAPRVPAGEVRFLDEDDVRIELLICSTRAANRSSRRFSDSYSPNLKNPS